MQFPIPFKSAQRLASDRNGVAAVEFAVGAPILLLAAVTMVDLALAAHERMNLDQAARAGAEFVMGDVSDVLELENLVAAAATGDFSDNAGDATSTKRPTVKVTNWCECPEAPGKSADCSETLCSNALPPSAYYLIATSKTYDAIILPDFTLKTQIQVQSR